MFAIAIWLNNSNEEVIVELPLVVLVLSLLFVSLCHGHGQ